MLKFVNYKISTIIVEKNFNKRSSRFNHVHTLADFERLTPPPNTSGAVD